MRSFRSTKIIATMGPASRDEDTIRALIAGGVNIFRLNFSHGTQADHAAALQRVRQVEAEIGRPIGVLMDLQGPKLRVGVVENDGVSLRSGDLYEFDRDPLPGNARRVCLPHPPIFEALSAGDSLLVDDGQLRFEVLGVDHERIRSVVRIGGTLRSRKGVNVPSSKLLLSALSPKDIDDLQFGLQLGVDWVALSFVQRAEDVRQARELIGGRALLMAKIEKPAALDDIDAIVDAADGIMVARGDLGVEMPLEQVPCVQKRLVRLARAAGKPVVIATQMLESMIVSPCPTRAEASDIATAVYDGADAVMLSAETASGRYPLEAVQTMDRVIRQAEADVRLQAPAPPAVMRQPHSVSQAIGTAIQRIAEVLPLAATVAYTTSGATALQLARQRPRSPILCLTPSATVARRIALAWGLHPHVDTGPATERDIVQCAIGFVRSEHAAEPGQPLALVAGIPFGTPGATNQLHLVWT